MARADSARLTARPGEPLKDRADEGGDGEFTLPGGRRPALLIVPPRRTDAPRPLVVLLHGAGADPGRTLPLVEDEAHRRGVIVLAPASAGSTWDVLVGGFGPDVETLDLMLATVFDRYRIDAGHIAIAGFSDGASYALTLGLANGDLFGDILAFSPGFAVPPALVGGSRVFVSHGVDDRVLPIDRTSRRLVPGLQRAGYDVTYDEFAGGHVVPPRIVALAFDRFLDAG